MIRFLTESKPALIESATKQLSLLEGRSTPPSSTVKIEQYHRVSPISRKEEMRRKQEFLNFSQVLLKYLEHKNKRMHSEAKVIIGECIDRNRKQERGYESVTAAMKRRLKDLVGEHYWERAKSHYYAHLKRNHNNSITTSTRSSVSPVKTHERPFVREESGGKVACR